VTFTPNFGEENRTDKAQKVYSMCLRQKAAIDEINFQSWGAKSKASQILVCTLADFCLYRLVPVTSAFPTSIAALTLLPQQPNKHKSGGTLDHNCT
jgi:hypothetical protein